MDETNTQRIEQAKDAWQQGVLARHRWGQHGEDTAQTECARIGELWGAAQPISDAGCEITEQIVALEICNWNLPKGIRDACESITSGQPADVVIGHMSGFTEERWKRIWAYYFSLRNWLPSGIRSAGFPVMLQHCDPNAEIQKHVTELLGPRSEIKQLYVERFCRCLEFCLAGMPGIESPDSAETCAHHAATAALEKEIREKDPRPDTLCAFKNDGWGSLELCHHKLFRRYDIILSSIGAGTWRGAMPQIGTTGFERAEEVEQLLAPIDAWLGEAEGNSLADRPRKQSCLGKPTPVKVFLAGLLVSLLRSQQLSATQRARRRTSEA